MQLALTIPTEWPVRVIDHQRVALIAGVEPTWSVVLAYGTLVPFPDDANAWVQRAMHVDVLPPATVKPGASETRKTKSGWQYRTLDADVILDGSVAEHRLAAFYRFVEYGAVVMVRARDRAVFDAQRERIFEVLATGSPDWQADGLVVCLHDLYDPAR